MINFSCCRSPQSYIYLLYFYRFIPQRFLLPVPWQKRSLCPYHSIYTHLTAAENNIFFFFSQFCVFLVQFLILFIIDRIIWFHAFLPGYRILSGNHCLRLGAKLKVLMFDNTGVWSLAVCIINNCHTLMIFFIQNLRFKTQTAVFQLAN